MKIFIDAGHNYSGGDTGAQGHGLKEQNITFPIANKLKELLVNAGHTVKMSRNNLTDNIGTSMRESINGRANMANTWGAELFVSIHCNAGGGIGTETLVYSSNGTSYNYAKKVQAAIVNNLGTVNRGVKNRPDLGVLRLTNMPAILIETAFIDNYSDAQLLKNKQEEFAKAIFEGITGQKPVIKQEPIVKELTDINEIVWEYGHRGLVTDKEGMIAEMEAEPHGRLYWLARKTLQYMRSNNI